jgi:hypothetical protein
MFLLRRPTSKLRLRAESTVLHSEHTALLMHLQLCKENQCEAYALYMHCMCSTFWCIVASKQAGCTIQCTVTCKVKLANAVFLCPNGPPEHVDRSGAARKSGSLNYDAMQKNL